MGTNCHGGKTVRSVQDPPDMKCKKRAPGLGPGRLSGAVSLSISLSGQALINSRGELFCFTCCFLHRNGELCRERDGWNKLLTLC